MRELVELRVPEELASEHLPPSLGVFIGYGIRKVMLDTSDPWFVRIGVIHRELRASGIYFSLGWRFHREYPADELARAAWLHLEPKKTFEPAGEECGTVYDDAHACPVCGAGAPQRTPLHLVGHAIPRKHDLARTIAGEVVVSARFADTWRAGGLVGSAFEPVLLSDRAGAPSTDHFQLVVPEARFDLGPGTRAGEQPFDDASEGRCPLGDTIGLNLITTVEFVDPAGPTADVMASRQHVGGRSGLLRPRPVLLISQRAFEVLGKELARNAVLEVATAR